MKVTVDFSQVEDFATLPAGQYPVVIESVELRESKSSEHPYLNFTLAVADGEFTGRKLWFIGSLSPKALWRLKALFDSFGFEGEQAELEVDDGSGILLSPELAGLAAMATVSVEQYQNKDRNRVDELLGADGIIRGSEVTKKASKASPEVMKKATPAKPAAKPAPKVVELVKGPEEGDELEAIEESVGEAEPPKAIRVSPFAKTSGEARRVFK